MACHNYGSKFQVTGQINLEGPTIVLSKMASNVYSLLRNFELILDFL